jgi:hypothetical protein
MAVPDIPVNEAATWIRDNTPPDALFLNSSYFFHPASLAGRKIFQGWPYFAWSAGYKTHDRDAIMKELFESTDQKRVCQLLSENHLSYSVIDSPWPLEEIRLINPLLTSQQPVFTNTEKTVSIYQTSTLCRPTD